MFSKSRFVLACGAALLIASTPVKAGFEWTPPEKQKPPAPAPMQPLPTVPTAPVTTVPIESEAILPTTEEIPDVTESVVEPSPEQTESPMPLSVEEPEEAVIEVVEEITEPQEQVVIEEEIVEEEIEIYIEEEKVSEMPPPVQPENPVILPELPQEEEINWNSAPQEFRENNIEQAPSSAPPDMKDQKAEIKTPLTDQQETVVSAMPEEKNALEPVAGEQGTSLSKQDNPEKTVDSRHYSSMPVAILPADTDQPLSELSSEDIFVEEALGRSGKRKTEQRVENSGDFEVVDGFGRDLPLALALGQIVPPHYAFSFGNGVNPGHIVSWQGGKPWNDVLDQMLEPIGVSYSIKNEALIALDRRGAKRSQAYQEPEKHSLVDDPVILPELEYEPVSRSMNDNPRAPLLQDDKKPVEESTSQENKEPSPLDEIYGAPQESEEKESNLLKLPSAQEQMYSAYIPESPGEDNSNKLSGLRPQAGEKKNDNADALASEQERIFWNDGLPLSEPEYMLMQQPSTAVSEDIISVVEADQFQDAQETEIKPPEHVNTTPQPDQDIMLSSKSIEQIIQTLPEKEEKEDVASSTPVPLTPQIIETPQDDQEQQENAVLDLPESEEPVKLASATVDSGFRQAPSDKILIWQAKKGGNLKNILEKWAEIENVKFVWEASENYKVTKDVFISSTFANAVEVLISKSIKHPPTYSWSETPEYALRISEE